ncbi:MAG: zinc-ribbon domain-containing protein [Oscillospiraceae bacterium]
MFCSNCGSQIPEGGKVCPNCGTPSVGDIPMADMASAAQPVPVNAGAAVTAEKAVRKFSISSLLKNKLVIAGLAAVVLAVVVIIIVSIAGSSSTPFAVAKNQIDKFCTEDYTTVFFYNGKQVKTELDGNNATVYANNDKSTVYVESDGALYMLSGDKLNEVNDECRVQAVAGFGSSIFYTSDDTLYVYNGSKATRITELDNDPRSFVSSPDGSACAWTIYDDGDILGYAWAGGKVSELDKMNRVLSVTNGGDLIYCETDSSKLGYIRNMSEDIESVKSMDSVTEFSADNRQLLFVSNGSTYVYDTSMESPVKLGRGTVRAMYPANGYYTANNFDNFVGRSSSGVKRYIRKGGEYDDSIDLISSFSYSFISEDGKSLLYYNNGKVYKRDTTSEDGDKITVARSVLSTESNYFATDSNFNNIYYINYDYELMYSNGREDGISTVYDNDSVSSVVLSTSGACPFIYDRSGGEGYVSYSVSGGNREKCSGVSTLDWFSNSGIRAKTYIFAVNADDELYISSDGKNFTNTKIILN